jgi:hypothetical protein
MRILPLVVLAGLSVAVAPALAQSVFTDGFEPDEPAAYACNVDGVMPPNFSLRMSTWRGTFSSPDGSPAATYPGGVYFPTPVGADRIQMRVVPFVPNPSQSVQLYFDEVQSRPNEGYQPGRPTDGMWFAISPCIGDMRPPNPFGEPFLRQGCRIFEKAGAIGWTTAASVAESDAAICKLEAGKTYYLTISPTNVLDGLQFGEHTCLSDTFSCEVGVILSQSVHN